MSAVAHNEFSQELGKLIDGQLPPDFEVMRADKLDPVQGRRDVWLYRGVVVGRSVIRSGFGSSGAARRAAWTAYNSATLMGAESDTSETPEPERYLPSLPKPPEVRDEYVVKFGSWEAMKSDLLAQLIHDAKSIRRAAKAIGVPKSTLAAWVKGGVHRGVWPRQGRDAVWTMGGRRRSVPPGTSPTGERT